VEGTGQEQPTLVGRGKGTEIKTRGKRKRKRSKRREKETNIRNIPKQRTTCANVTTTTGETLIF
jgi:hypothetical protein